MPALARPSALAITLHPRRMSARWPPFSFRIKLPLSSRWLVVETHACYRAPNPALHVAASHMAPASDQLTIESMALACISRSNRDLRRVLSAPAVLSIVAMLYTVS
jgi:hypothetical protein